MWVLHFLLCSIYWMITLLVLTLLISNICSLIHFWPYRTPNKLAKPGAGWATSDFGTGSPFLAARSRPPSMCQLSGIPTARLVWSIGCEQLGYPQPTAMFRWSMDCFSPKWWRCHWQFCCVWCWDTLGWVTGVPKNMHHENLHLKQNGRIYDWKCLDDTCTHSRCGLAYVTMSILLFQNLSVSKVLSAYLPV